MASICSRIVARTASTIKSARKTTSPAPRFALPTRSATRHFSISRTPSELSCMQSIMPLHSALASARLISCFSSSVSFTALSQGT